MKKFTVVIIAALIAMCSACTGNRSETFDPKIPAWLNESMYGTALDKNFSETLVYDVSLTPSADAEIGAELSGTYTAMLTAGSYEETDCYVLETRLEVTGKYTAGGEEKAVNDSDVTKTYFTYSGGFGFLGAEQQATSTLPVNSSGEPDGNGNRFVTISYETTTRYGERDAETTFHIVGDKEAQDPYFNLDDGFEGKIKKYNRGNYIDRNLLMFFGRCFEYKDSMYYSFSTVDVLANRKTAMRASALTEGEGDAATATKRIDIKNLRKNGSYLGSANGEDYVLGAKDVFTMNVRIDETYGGNSLKLVYFADAASYHHYLYSAERVMPYSIGTMTYTLKEITGI